MDEIDRAGIACGHACCNGNAVANPVAIVPPPRVLALLRRRGLIIAG